MIHAACLMAALSFMVSELRISSSSSGTTAHCGLWPVEQAHSIFPYLSVAYPGILFGGGGVQQIQLKTERTGIWGQWPPSQGFWSQL
jgi:hypothetical protein